MVPDSPPVTAVALLHLGRQPRERLRFPPGTLLCSIAIYTAPQPAGGHPFVLCMRLRAADGRRFMHVLRYASRARCERAYDRISARAAARQ